MSYRLTYLDDAKQDMREITKYLAQFYASTARNFLTTLKERVRSLKDMPYMCPAYEKDPFFQRMVIKDHLLYYSVDEERKLVVIHRVFHHAQDIDRHMLEYRTQE